MEATTPLSYEQVLHLAEQLPVEQLVKLKDELDTTLAQKKNKNKQSFREFLLEGPVMTDEQYANFKENREYFNQWRKE